MRFEKFMRQTATYWAPNGGDDGQGRKLFAAPRTIICRWDDKSELIQTHQRTITSQAQVMVPEVLQETGYLALGDLTATADPTSIAEAFEIQALSNTPDLRNLSTLHIAIL